MLVFCRIWVNHHQQGMSNFWKGILKQLESFLTCTEIMVGDGKEAAFWRDYWSSDINSVNLTCALVDKFHEFQMIIHSNSILW